MVSKGDCEDLCCVSMLRQQEKIWLLASLQHSRSIRLALLTKRQQQQLEMIGYWLLATFCCQVLTSKRLLTLPYIKLAL